MMTLERSPYGNLPDGRKVTRFTVKNGAGLSVSMMDYGCTLLSVEVPDKAGKTVNVTLSFDDLAGYLANLADLWKMEVYALANHLNSEVFGRQVIPQGSIDVTPSAELSPDQNVDEKKGDPLVYPYHDVLFKSWVESWDRTTPEEILRFAMPG